MRAGVNSNQKIIQNSLSTFGVGGDNSVMPDANDMDLVREFARDNSEAAFIELVRRHINLVYSVALRCTGEAGDAQDVTQAVFIILARKAAGLRERTLLTGWLYETTRFTAARLLRTNARRHAREQEAYMQSTLNECDLSRHSGATADVWTQLSPHLEAAMSKLAERDRTLLVLRFYENKSGPEAAALLGIREDTAHKRVTRAIEKLRKFFAQRGVTLTATAIAGAVSANSVQAAPAGLAVTVTAAKGAAIGSSTLTLVKGALKLMAWTKAQAAIVIGVVVLLAAGTTTVLIEKVNSRHEPMYQGNALSVWLKEYDNMEEVFANNGAKLQELDKIIKLAGTNAIPTLLRLLQDEDSKEHDSRSNGNEASNGFRALGDTTKDAIPALIKIYEQNPAARLDVLYCLSCIGPAAEDVVPWLLQKLPDSSDKERDYIITTLGEIHAQPDQVVPALINYLNDSDSTIRVHTALALGSYGKDATQAIPQLTDLLNDQIKGVRMKAAIAIKEIDHEAAVKAGLK
jgi:RNA polymerase sigma factor (sigma-70 family)